jgi:5-methylcytosine-specific restriction protein A
MLVKDLSAPVTASKADWLLATTWLGFSPSSGGLKARAQCQTTVKRQFGDGYVLEYITKSFGSPNAGFEADPIYLQEMQQHELVAGRLIAIHKLLPDFRPLDRLVGPEEYARIQDMWSKTSDRVRWSVAFPIVESYEILGKPLARDVFGDRSYRRLYHRQSATLRELNSDERASLADLQISRLPALNEWIAIEGEFAKADRSEIDPKLLADISRDLSDKALEGFSTEQLAKIRRRAAWIAARFARSRGDAGTLHCDNCALDPGTLIGNHEVKPRSLLDVHHKHPLALGKRLTTFSDLALMCPTCHRLEHRLMTLGASLFAMA